MNIITPKLNPQDAIDEVLRMTGLDMDEYAAYVELCGYRFAHSLTSELVQHPQMALDLAELFVQNTYFWPFFKNQVYLQSLQFIYDWYNIDNSVNGKRMKLAAWRNSIQPVRIIARPPLRNFHANLRHLTFISK